MPSPSEFLTKHISINKEIVTFHRLSFALEIQVNDAKNELASFHASSKSTDEPAHATFLLAGDVTPVNSYGSYRDGMEMEVDDDGLELVSTTRIVLVGEGELEDAKAQFASPPSVHIYSLSPAAIKDAALLVPAAEYARSKYATQSVGANVKLRAFASKKEKTNDASSTKLKLPLDKQITGKPASSEKSGNVGQKSKDMKKGTLDWSRAKSKPEKEDANIAKREPANSVKMGKEKPAVKNDTKPMKQDKVAPKAKSKSILKTEKMPMKMESEESEMETKVVSEKPKRGIKRPSGVMSLSDSEEEKQDGKPARKIKPRTSASASPFPSKPASASDKGVKVKRGVLISDDEDGNPDVKSNPSRRNGKGKGRAVLSDDEGGPNPSVKATMDLDDSHFIRHNKTSAETQSRAEEEDVEMASDSEPVPVRAKPKRKPKKVVPIGSNGLPKKRIVKSRKSKDTRGYMVTQDYSSYESASESEQVPETSKSVSKSKKDKGAKKNVENAPSRSVSGKTSAPKPRLKPRNSVRSSVDGDESSVGSTKATKVSGEGDAEKNGSSSGGGKSNGEKPSNGNKRNLMNYFGKS